MPLTKKKPSFEDTDPNQSFSNEKSTLVSREPPSNDADMFRQRTDTEKLVTQIRLFLKKAEIKTIWKKGEDNKFRHFQIEQPIPGTKPLVNETGVVEITLAIKNLINNHTVQGNTTREIYNNVMLVYTNTEAVNFIVKREDWGMKVNDYSLITNTLFTMIGLFLSRTIDNYERIGYNEGFREERRETSVPETRKRMFGLFNR